MKILFVLLFLFSNVSFASQKTIDQCIEAWGTSPFKKGHRANKTMQVGVKVFGIGSRDADEEKTASPSLILVKPNINVLGKTTLRLMNPNGWYCFATNVNVLGKLNIVSDCKSHFASAIGGAKVMAADDTTDGVSVLGAIRIRRLNCN